ncbi:cytochrome c peroxidase [Myxococcus sp. RHSTA-1-4]|uniref:cytochrome-c peroxidase n=1 Tax=Myxococcus sp. RHSTA-1-4 TaxID=2874601 RepID=UPI001CBB7A36|nr:c-type cytochrome [Myxococcus sp. RHSTA-1-4]
MRASAVLGEALFFDTRLSADGTVACATCHRPEAAFADSLPVTPGVYGRVGTRNAPSLIGAGSTRELFWDGRRGSLEELVLDPLTTPEEHGIEDMPAVLASVRARHASGFARVFPGEGVTERTLAQALADYVRTLAPAPSAFERYRAGDAGALTPAQRRGLALFSGRAACARCHRLEGDALTDGAYHAGEVLPELAPRLAAAAREVSRMAPEARRAAVPARVEVAALGRYTVTLRTADVGRFRTPSLRNVAVTAPYMHDGSVATLAQAVERELYYRTSEGLRVGDLTPAERADLVEFLQALTSPVLPSGRPAAASSLP